MIVTQALQDGRVVFAVQEEPMNPIKLGKYCRKIGKIQLIQRYYAVDDILEGTKEIYTTWEEVQPHILGRKKLLHKSFGTREEAEQWLKSKKSINKNDAIATH
jgi:viroplasmin and RNaseH domain-containing protein